MAIRIKTTWLLKSCSYVNGYDLETILSHDDTVNANERNILEEKQK